MAAKRKQPPEIRVQCTYEPAPDLDIRLRRVYGLLLAKHDTAAKPSSELLNKSRTKGVLDPGKGIIP